MLPVVVTFGVNPGCPISWISTSVLPWATSNDSRDQAQQTGIALCACIFTALHSPLSVNYARARAFVMVAILKTNSTITKMTLYNHNRRKRSTASRISLAVVYHTDRHDSGMGLCEPTTGARGRDRFWVTLRHTLTARVSLAIRLFFFPRWYSLFTVA